MNKLNLADVTKYVEQNIGDFHEKRLAKVNSIKLSDVLKAKNPYLFKAKNVNTASEIIDGILSAFLSSSEEGIFGNWLERLAVFVNNSVYGGQKAVVDGIDLDFLKDGKRYLVAIKSGPNWGNDSQYKKLVDQFNTAKKRSATSGGKEEIICVNGCCYGRSNPSSEYKAKGYYKMCGQRFWELISGEPNLYVDIIEPIGFQAEKNNLEFSESYSKVKNRMEKEFLIDFVTDEGSINWDKLLKFNSLTPPKSVK
ncbi:PmeII family type II restriction endonuclease [Flavobacterium sp. SLB02]|uniref:PmeII family type II restriction endonuclease n=1 Tax=Flavobacterium sp. SLB02 TaxID=2665645 RepID=UPI001ABFC494|nr:PmeII family type II restriction endonuclease [Flavobacterium sp. SLB02]